MAWKPVYGIPAQLEASGVAAVGHYLKFYAAGTTTAINMATDSGGGTTLAKAILDASGYPLNGSSAIFVPHINQKYKIVLYANSTDADNNTFGNALFNVDGLSLEDTLNSTRYETGTIAAAASHTGVSTGFQIKTDYFDSNVTAGSGSTVAFTGTTTGGKAGNFPDADGFFYDADGKQFSLGVEASILHFGALGDGSTDDFTPFTAAIAWLVGGTGRTLDFVHGATYITDSRIPIAGAANFVIHGNGATIKAKDAMTVGAGEQILFLTSCTDGIIYDLNVDSNRAGRTPAESSSHGIHIYTSCARLKFINCKSDNATTDGWSLDSVTPTTLATLPTDIHLINCSATNAYRGNLSLINSVRFRDFNGVYTAATGTAPQHGIDCEPDSSGDQGNQDARFYNTSVRDNVGFGFNNSGTNSEVRIYDMVSNSNGVAGIQNAGLYMEINGASFDGYTDTITTGVAISTIDAGTTIFNNLVFNDIVLTSTKACVVTGGGSGGNDHQIVNGISGHDIDAPVFRAVSKTQVSNISMNEVKAGGAAQIILAGDESVLRGVTLRQAATGDAATSSVSVIGDDCVVDGVNLINPGATSGGTIGAVTFETNADRGTCRNVSITQLVGIPAGQIGVKFVEPPLIAENISCRSAGTDYTGANVMSFTAGTTGARLSNINPGFYTQNTVGGDVGDAAATLTRGTSEMTQLWSTTLTADRAVTLSTTNAITGDKFFIIRDASAGGTFNLNVGTGPLATLGPGQQCVVDFDGTAWFLSSRTGLISDEILLSVVTVAFNANADTTLYTVPAARRCILTKAIVVGGADAGATTDLSIGQNGAETDFVPATTLSNIDAANDVAILQPIMGDPAVKGKSYAAATVIQAQVTNQSGGASNTVYLYGILT